MRKEANITIIFANITGRKGAFIHSGMVEAILKHTPNVKRNPIIQININISILFPYIVTN